MDVLDDILGSLRLTGGVVIDAEFSGDFCVRAEFTPDHFAPFFPMPETLISYHYVRSGRLIVEVDGLPPVDARPGDDRDPAAQRPASCWQAASAFRRPMSSEISWITADGRAPSRDRHRRAQDRSVVRLPRHREKQRASAARRAAAAARRSTPRRGEAQWLDSSMRFLAEQQPVAGDRRAACRTVPGAGDPRICRPAAGRIEGLARRASPTRPCRKALSIIHKRYAEDLDVEGLAREAGVSRTVLGERFGELLGEPPMRYCARWRMRMAANMLRDGKQNTANIAYSVGFNSEAAFNRAFKREYGVPPATWRQRGSRPRKQARARSRASRAAAAAGPLIAPPHDGTRLAYSVVGEGPPLVKTANWLNHIQHDWDSPLWRHWIDEFTSGRSLIRYDERGNGLSDWDTPDLSFDAFVDDLECVADCLELEQFDLLAISQGAAVAVAYAVRHPRAGSAAGHLQWLCGGLGGARRPGRSGAARGDADA